MINHPLCYTLNCTIKKIISEICTSYLNMPDYEMGIHYYANKNENEKRIYIISIKLQKDFTLSDKFASVDTG